MTLTPLVLAICLNASSEYKEACRAALEQGAAQSGLAGKFEYLTKETGEKVIKYIDPSAEVELVAAVSGYAYQVLSRKEASIALPNPLLKSSSIGFVIGEKKIGASFNISF